MTQIEKLQNSFTVLGINCTGGGSGLAPELLSRGGSSTLLDFFNVLYSQQSLEKSIGPVFEFCSMDTANRMAIKALGDIVSDRRGHRIGVGITASLSTGPSEREGRINNAFISVICSQKHMTLEMDFKKIGYASRELQEDCLVNTALFHILDFCNIAAFPKEIFNKGSIYRRSYRAPMHFPGSFNPIHKQHVKIAEVVNLISNSPVQFTIADDNVDKGGISQEEFGIRSNNIRDLIPDARISIDRGLFIDKAKESPFTTFIVGTDTINRVLDKSYYKDYDRALFRLFIEQKARFLVFQREGYDLIDIPKEYSHAVEVMDEDSYKDDGTSSSKIRANVGLRA